MNVYTNTPVLSTVSYSLESLQNKNKALPFMVRIGNSNATTDIEAVTFAGIVVQLRGEGPLSTRKVEPLESVMLSVSVLLSVYVFLPPLY